MKQEHDKKRELCCWRMKNGARCTRQRLISRYCGQHYWSWRKKNGYEITRNYEKAERY